MTLACGGPANGVSASSAQLIASWCAPPSAHPIQFTSERVASWRAALGMSSGRDVTTKRARARVTAIPE
jgi:hypothetical protein